MSVIIFILVLGVLIFIHELGHFLVAKKSGIRVDEFAIGFPPRLFSIKKGETAYSLNLIPFGGYVKIYGESPLDGATEKSATDSMINKSKSTQALVLVAGVVFNFLLAMLIFVFLFMKGGEFNTVLVPYATEAPQVRIDFVQDDSLASRAGIIPGDAIVSVTTQEDGVLTDNALILETLYDQKKVETNISLIAQNGTAYEVTLVPENQDQKFGLSLVESVYIKTNPLTATWYGFLATGHLAKLTTIGLFQFFGDLFTGNANFEEVAGPVGIVGLVGQASETGINSILILTAIISINLAVLNLMPFPALDGGRLLIVGIEAVLKRDLNYQKVAIANLIGFALLIGLMILLTFHDIKNLF